MLPFLAVIRILFGTLAREREHGLAMGRSDHPGEVIGNQACHWVLVASQCHHRFDHARCALGVDARGHHPGPHGDQACGQIFAMGIATQGIVGPTWELAAELFEDPPKIAGGRLTLKEAPGLGLTLSERALKKFGERIL